MSIKRKFNPSGWEGNGWKNRGVIDSFTSSTRNDSNHTPYRRLNLEKASLAAESICSTPVEDVEDTEDRPFKRSFLEAPSPCSASTESLRLELEVVVEGATGEAYPPLSSFQDPVLTGILPPFVMKALSEMSILEPTPIQAQALPIILGGHDVIGIAKTGSGKTLAFLIPAIVHIEAQAAVPQDAAVPITLMLAPTRELAVQICDEAKKLAAHSYQGSHKNGIWAACVYGGKHWMPQLEAAKGSQILVATPGRLTDFIDRGHVALHRVTYFVLDEADRMLDFGFATEVTSVGEKIRPDRHMLFFSATWPSEVQQLARQLCHQSEEPVLLSVGQRDDGSVAVRADLVQEVRVFEVSSWSERDKAKQKALETHLHEALQEPESKILVFVSSKNFAHDLSQKLLKEGFAADEMHGNRSQDARLDVLRRFRTGETRLLVATDVLGRGVDIPDISHVVIYDMGEIEDYIHRAGRTGRGPYGKAGHVLTFFEYFPKHPNQAAELAKVLEDAGQVVPEALRQIVEEVSSGIREAGDSWGSAYSKKWVQKEKTWTDDQGVAGQTSGGWYQRKRGADEGYAAESPCSKKWTNYSWKSNSWKWDKSSSANQDG